MKLRIVSFSLCELPHLYCVFFTKLCRAAAVLDNDVVVPVRRKAPLLVLEIRRAILARIIPCNPPIGTVDG